MTRAFLFLEEWNVFSLCFEHWVENIYVHQVINDKAEEINVTP